MSEIQPASSAQTDKPRVPNPDDQVGQFNGRVVLPSIASLYARMKYPDVVTLDDAQQKEIDRIVRLNDTINSMIGAEVDIGGILDPNNRQIGPIDNKRLETSHEFIDMVIIRAELEDIDLEEELADKPSKPVPGNRSGAANESATPSDKYFAYVSKLLDDSGPDAVTAENYKTRLPNSSELNASATNNENDDVQYLGVTTMGGSQNESEGLIKLLNTLKKTDGKTRIATLHDKDAKHFVTIIARKNELCIFDSLPSTKSGDKARKLISKIQIENSELSVFGEIKLVEKKLQEHSDQGQGTWLVNSCGLFSLWLHDNASKNDAKDQTLVEMVEEFAKTVDKMGKDEKENMNKATRLEMLEAAKQKLSQLLVGVDEFTQP